ncbi:MAG: hypothetical protein A2504_11680 [Bdellovibrionales bacterium RIFOXYD12_FULL_39_22]|nr:MAG: hypothetical protein A2385_16195 [Bdellovibrionales bacterium RIFOXYB1_FULL_39_21]OFZ44501.1 MAG: hypothetical protein A2485_06700 [Bdellovibrionales bacterium RIFOXYC12_FULL_39_17]OFZ49857.1 MAG: hypothetical protein A2404_00765 [Bdellovibrionales bacterium RIFOXYC1_FULL_39_130]OFZ73321.1 MAG: hypothetical protein A2451_04130 [Bdellovibrionales bacterium RIFOXYC2_FULL_39_8]OFZ76862.1 MAG: hypothetical protein A2560_05565 [Bdellovibrionales bacterium RIFOXYD1_FULL_39_84]OFZ95789.1 MAG:
MTFFAARLLFLTNKSYTPPESDVVAIQKILISIPQHLNPIDKLSSDELFAKQSIGNNDMRLFNEFFNDVFDKRSIDYSSDKNCFNSFFSFFNNALSYKFTVWEEFRCNKRTDLPDEFFETGATIHPSGNSYAYLAIKSRHGQFHSDSWIKKHLPLITPAEIRTLRKNLPNMAGNNEQLKYILEMSDNEFEYFENSVRLFLSKEKLFFRASGKEISTPFFTYRLDSSKSYFIYKLSDLNNALEDTPFVVSATTPNASCKFREANLCWNYSFKHLLAITNNTTITFFILSVLSILLIVWILLKKIKQQREQEEQKRLALQVLSHEFRTPVTSMILLTEQINKMMDSIPTTLQGPFLQLATNVFRLQRLTEKTKNYLHLGKKVDQQISKIDSINEFFQNYVEDMSTPETLITLQKLDPDLPINIDQYWIDICIKNLIENAKTHGRPPINIKLNLKKAEKSLIIAISDSGECEFSTLDKLTAEFVKGSHSEGSGLGLNIVYKTVKNLGGILTFSNRPTTFTIQLPLDANARMKG